MKRSSLLRLLTMACLLAIGSSTAHAQTDALLRRFALIVAADDGGSERAPLKYAERDARAFDAVLEQLGGVDRTDSQRLSQPTAEALENAFSELRRRVREAQQRGARTEVVFYYSGHSDETALLLGDQRFPYAALRKLLDELPVDVRIAVLDSCASGAFTRLKGGVRRAPFLLDRSSQVSGHAFLTSSSADEAAQESDRIGGSFFTHYLISGLRGAADASGDRKVTLTEAYRFAFEETLARTAQTKFGSQHPAYEIRLVGTGDLVMTDLRATTAELLLDPSLEGRLFAWDAQRTLFAELAKSKGRTLVLALPPGTYKIELTRGAQFFTTEVHAVTGKPQTLTSASFHEVVREATLARGVRELYEVRPFAASVIPPISTNAQAGHPVLNHLGLSLLYDEPAALSGIQLSLFGVSASQLARGLQLAGLFTHTRELAGLQLSGTANATKLARGVQLTFGANYAGDSAEGIQLSGAANYARALRGAQLAAGLNLAGEHIGGLQLASINWSRALTGMQLGAINLAREVEGLQVGLLNVAAGRVRGLQLGLINYADEADFSLAALGITRQGGAHVLLAITDVAAPELSLRLEANYNYSFVSLGLSPYGGQEEHAYSFGAGLGAKAPLLSPYLWLDVDLGVQLVQPWRAWYRQLRNSLWQLRLLARLQLHERIGLFAGLTVNVLLQTDPSERITPGLLTRGELLSSSGGTRLLLWPGFAVGVRL